MKSSSKSLAIVAAVAIIGFSMAGCATNSSVAGATGPHGFFGGNGSAAALTAGAEEIASYSVILGLVDTGYAGFLAAVKKAEAEGKSVVSVTRWMVFLTKTTAYIQ